MRVRSWFCKAGYCCIKGKMDCPAMSPPATRLDPGYACTRSKGHRGDHVACAPWRHRVCVWRKGIRKKS